jgi:uncharacterized protein YcfJ
MTNDQPIDRENRNENPRTMGGAIGGAAGVGAAAGLGLATFGPIGAVVGALAGAAGGWWAGREVVRTVEEVDRADNDFRRSHEHAGATRPYEEVRHGYQLGYLAGRNPDNSNRTFDEMEAELRGAWVEAHLHDEDPVDWDDVVAHARQGYEIARQRD